MIFIRISEKYNSKSSVIRKQRHLQMHVFWCFRCLKISSEAGVHWFGNLFICTSSDASGVFWCPPYQWRLFTVHLILRALPLPLETLPLTTQQLFFLSFSWQLFVVPSPCPPNERHWNCWLNRRRRSISAPRSPVLISYFLCQIAVQKSLFRECKLLLSSSSPSSAPRSSSRPWAAAMDQPDRSWVWNGKRENIMSRRARFQLKQFCQNCILCMSEANPLNRRNELPYVPTVQYLKLENLAWTRSYATNHWLIVGH